MLQLKLQNMPEACTMEMKSRMGLVSMYSRTSQTKPSPSFCNDSSVVYFDAPKFVCTPLEDFVPPPLKTYFDKITD